MMKAERRRALAAAMALGGSAVLPLLAGRVARAQGAREIAMTAQRWKFTPAEIPLKAGERVVLAIRSLDFEHGFHVPVLGLRTDLVPGQVVRVEIHPQTPGPLDFLCDNFCGDGHEEMNGRFLVAE